MPNMSLVKHSMPEQEPAVRAANFREVALGYTRDIAMEEADRCLRCKNSPCVSGCPVNVPIPDFIAKIKEGDVTGAYDIIRSQNALPAICGRVCPQESQCESKCVRGIKGEPVAIGRLERFAADTAMAEEGGRDRQRPRGTDLCGRTGEGRMGCYNLRSPAHRRRRADVRNSGIPPSQGAGRPGD